MIHRIITKKELLKKLDISTGVLADLIRNGMPKEGEMFNLIRLSHGEKIGLKTY